MGNPELNKSGFDAKRMFFLLLGVALFLGVNLSPSWGDAVDPQGNSFALTREGKAALGLFLLTVVWWVSEVVPIGVTSITVGVLQALVMIRPAREVFTDFMDPSVWFIFGSLAVGMAFTRTGLTRRMAYKMLTLVGERTSMIYLGCFTLTAGLTLIMAHTAVAATVYPLFMAIHAMYTDKEGPTRFGKGLFIGMAFVAGAGSIITLLGAARGAVALGFYRDITGQDISFFQLTYYMLPVGVLMTALLWVFFMVFFRPERKTIPGLRERAKDLQKRLGPITRNEILALVFVLSAITLLGLRSVIPALQPLDKSAILLTTTVLFFLFKVLKLEDLESTSWNIILLFGGAMSLGFCLVQTGAAEWLAIHWLALFEGSPRFVFLLSITFFVLVMTNLVMNVAAIALVLPVALVLAPHMAVSSEVILFGSLVPAGMPFLLLVGAAPNAIAYGSGQFTSREFFTAGIPASIVLMAVLAVFMLLIWPWMGMPVFL
jgi:solute carrier family 13 (sodium-dependent dicarboxylate transporter), member 2/3/5